MVPPNHVREDRLSVMSSPERCARRYGLPTLMVSCTALTGCSFDTPPRVSVDSVTPLTMTEGSDSHIQLDVNLDLHNPTEEPIQLERFQYTLKTGADTVWSGSWSALRTLPPKSTVTMSLPAVIPATPPIERGQTNWVISGDVSYKAPGRWAQILFDTGFRRPTHDFAAEGVITASKTTAEPVVSTP